MVLYVSTEGSDDWSGRLAEPDEAKADGPLGTFSGAQARIRELKAGVGKDGPETAVTVYVRGGVYRQEEPLVFTPRDSGSECSHLGYKYPVTYAAYPGEEPVISGGRVIDGWEPAGEGEQDGSPCEGELWRTRVPRLAEESPWDFNQLFIDGRRRNRARLPGSRKFFYTDGPSRKDQKRAFFFSEGDLKEWGNLQDAVVVVYHSWVASVHHIESVDIEVNRVTVREPTDHRGFGNWQHRQRYYVENVFEGLGEPGEWYLDRETETLYYCPMEDEDMADGSVEVVAPVVTGPLVAFKGNSDEGAFVEHLHFRGLSFRHTNADMRENVLAGMRQAVVSQPALIQAEGLRYSVFAGCEIAHSGGHGIWLGEGCSDNLIDQCHIHSLGGGGVYIGGTGTKGLYKDAPARRNTINNNFIHDGSHQFRGANGIWIGKSSSNTVTHNEISNVDWTGVSVGWQWNFRPTTAHHNRIEYNYIHHIGNGDGLSDMAGIYLLGVSPGTTIRNNHIHDVYHYRHCSHSSGIYLDQATSDVRIENNLVYRIGTSPLYMHYGRDCVIRNNILALGGAAGQLRRGREDRRCHYIAEGNIVYSDHPQMLGGVWEDGDWGLGRNLYWSTEDPPEFSGVDFDTWRQSGNDEGSVVADPLFVDPDEGDFSLRPDSPAFELGFVPIEVEKAGLRGEPEWVNLPRQYPHPAIVEVPPPPALPPVDFDFEADEVGFPPRRGRINEGGGAVVVSDDTASTGNQSLKFIDAPGQVRSWTPHINYERTYSSGRVHFSWDMLNCADNPNDFYVALRDYSLGRYAAGPFLHIEADGTVRAGDQTIAVMPLGEWVRVELTLALGEGTPKSYKLIYREPGKEPVSMELPYVDSRFETITWAGIATSQSDREAVFYIDNLRISSSE